MDISRKALKAFNKIKLRRINILNETFLWKRGHLHLDNFKYSKCVEKVVIYLENQKNSPLILFFREEDNELIKGTKENEKWMVGYPNQGVIWKSVTGKTVPYGENDDAIQIDLNNPSTIENIVKLYYKKEWNPNQSSKSSYMLENALTILDETKLIKVFF